MSALFPLPDLATHADGELLCAIGRAQRLNDAADLARRRGEKAFRRWLRDNATEATRLGDFITATPATTPEGILAKVEHALRDVDPEEPDFGGIIGAYKSALWDVLRSGRLG